MSNHFFKKIFIYCCMGLTTVLPHLLAQENPPQTPAVQPAPAPTTVAPAVPLKRGIEVQKLYYLDSRSVHLMELDADGQRITETLATVVFKSVHPTLLKNMRLAPHPGNCVAETAAKSFSLEELTPQQLSAEGFPFTIRLDEKCKIGDQAQLIFKGTYDDETGENIPWELPVDFHVGFGLPLESRNNLVTEAVVIEDPSPNPPLPHGPNPVPFTSNPLLLPVYVQEWFPFQLQRAELEIAIEHPRVYDLTISLIPPDGNEILLRPNSDYNTTQTRFNFRFSAIGNERQTVVNGLQRLWKTSIVGEWKVKVLDSINGNVGKVLKADLVLYPRTRADLAQPVSPPPVSARTSIDDEDDYHQQQLYYNQQFQQMMISSDPALKQSLDHWCQSNGCGGETDSNHICHGPPSWWSTYLEVRGYAHPHDPLHSYSFRGYKFR